MPTYRNGPYSVTVSEDGRILVKPGDWLSKYSYAIYKNYTTLDVFARLDASGNPIPIVNKDLIYAGETLIHLPDYKKRPGQAPKPGPGAPPSQGPQPAQVAPVDLNQPHPPTFPSGLGFAWEWESQTRELGFFLVQFVLRLEGSFKRPNGGDPIILEKPIVRNLIEERIFEEVEAALANNQQLREVIVAVAGDSGYKFAQALYHVMKNGLILARLGYFQMVLDPGLERTRTPVNVSLAGAIVDFPLHRTLLLNASVSGQVHIGLSLKGWTEVIKEVGRQAMTFLQRRSLHQIAQWLVAEGALTGAVAIGTLVGTVALTTLVSSAYRNALSSGEALGLATWYSSAYTARVFGKGKPRPNSQRAAELVEMGWRDALLDARDVLRAENNPAANGSDEEALRAYRDIIIAATPAGQDPERVLQQRLNERVVKILEK